MSGWQDALDVQMGVMRYWRSPPGQQYANVFLADQEKKRALGDLARFPLAASLYRATYGADPIWIDGPMMDLWEAAAASFESEPMIVEDVLIPNGFAVLPRPIYILDRNDKQTANRAIGWHQISIGEERKPGLLFHFYTHRDDSDDFSEEEEIGTLPEYSLVHWCPLAYGDGMSGVSHDQDWLRWLQALWRLMGQTLSTSERVRLPRGQARRAARNDREPYVTVIRLRRPKHQRDGEPTETDYAHRWIVGGHWRNQPYPSLGVHRQIWISPYCKGPEDKPLKIRKARAYELVR